MNKFYAQLLDIALSSLEKGVWIPENTLFYNAPEGLDSAIRLLVDEGYIEESDNRYKITFKGKSLVDNGGFTAKYRNERIQLYCAIIAAITSVLSLAIAIIAIFL